MENIYHTIRGRTKSPRTLESISKDPLPAAFIDIHIYIDNICSYFIKVPNPQKKLFELRSNGDRLF